MEAICHRCSALAHRCVLCGRTGHSPPTPLNGFFGQTFLCFFHAVFEWLISIGYSLRQDDFFKPLFDLLVQIKIAIPRRMFRVTMQSLAGGLIPADAFQNPPGLAKRIRISRGATQLVCSRESKPVQEYFSCRILPEEI